MIPTSKKSANTSSAGSSSAGMPPSQQDPPYAGCRAMHAARRLPENSLLLRSAAESVDLRWRGKNVLTVALLRFRAFSPHRLAHEFFARSRDKAILGQPPITTRSLFLLSFLLTALFLPILPGNALAAKKSSATLEKQYRLARAYYHNLLSNSARAESRKNWLTGIKNFQRLYNADPRHTVAPLSLFMTGVLSQKLYARSRNPLDLGEAIAGYDDLVSRYPAHRLADDALYTLGHINLTDKKDRKHAAVIFARIAAVYPNGDMTQKAVKELRRLKHSPVELAAPASKRKSERKKNDTRVAITSLRHGSTNYYTRLVIETNSPVQYEDALLASEKDRPRRLYVNIQNCWIPDNLTATIPINDGLLKQVRSSQYSPDTVRVVLDTQSISDYKISSLDGPHRLIIDVWGKGRAKKTVDFKVPFKSTPSLPQQLGLVARRIILDPGHGGRDPGAIGPNGIYEKDIVLAVALKTARKLRSEYSYEVVLTRDRDEYLSLEERTEIANTQAGDIFISLHVNAAPNKAARGIETYYLSQATSKYEMRAATLENAPSNRQLSDLQAILMDLLNTTKIDESIKLAGYVQESMVTGLARTHSNIHNLGVKKAPFIVLIGAQMPAVLTEIAFLSNKAEAKRLKNDSYLTDIASHLSAGIAQYITEEHLAFSGQ